MSWKNLDIKQKAELIKLGIRSGIKDINQIRQLYDNVQINDYQHPYYTSNTLSENNIQSQNQDNTLIKGMIDEFNKNKHNIPQQNIYSQNNLGTERVDVQQSAQFRQFKNGGYKNKPPFEEWYKTVPVDRNDTTYYNLRKAYEELPFEQLEKWRTATLEQLNNEQYHLPTVSPQSLEFLKSRNHPSIQYELDWYNSPEGKDFRDKHSLDTTGNYYRYIPNAKGGYISNNPTYELIGKVNKFGEGGYEDEDDENKNINNSILGRYVQSKVSKNNQGSHEQPTIVIEEPIESTYAEQPSLGTFDNQQMYTAGYADPTIVIASKPTEKEWLQYIKDNNITTRSKEYSKLPANLRSLVVQEEIRRKRDKSVLPTVAAITLPTLIPAATASLVGSGALTAAADAAGNVGTKIAGTNLGKATSAFFNNPYLQMGLTGWGAYYIPQYFKSGIDNFRNKQYAEGIKDFGNIALEGAGVLGSVPDALRIAGQISGSTAGLGLLASSKNFRFSPITNKVFRKKSKESTKKVNDLYAAYNKSVAAYDQAALEYNKAYNKNLKDMFFDEYIQVSNLMDKEARSRGYSWASEGYSSNPFDYRNWEASRRYTPSLLEKSNLDHVKRYEDYNKVAQEYLSSNGEVKMVGSTLSNARGVTNSDYLASDIDFLTTKKNAEELANQYNLRKNMSGTAYVNQHASVAGREMELNAQFIDEDPNGNAIGKLALEYFSIKDPKGYNKFVQDCIDNNKPILETPLPIKSDELFNSISEDDILQRVILDNIGSGHDKHRKRVQRSLLSVDSNTVKKYKQALNNSMESLFGENYIKFAEEFPNIKFDDVEQNKNFLKRVFGNKGYDIEAVAKDPERMEVITEMYYYSYSTSGRHTKGVDNVFEGKVVPADSGLGVSIINPKGSTGGGSIAGGGTNTGLGKAPAGYGNYESAFQLPITYNKSKINNLNDLVDQVEHITSRQSQDLSRYLGDYVQDISYDSQNKLKHIDEVTREHDIPIVIDEGSHIGSGYTGVFADANLQRSAKISELDRNVASIFETPSGMVNAKKLFDPIIEMIPLDKWDNPDDLIKVLNEKHDELLSKRNELLEELKLDRNRANDAVESSIRNYEKSSKQKQELAAKIKKLQALETALYFVGGEALVYGGTKYLTKNIKERKEAEANNEQLETLDTIPSKNYTQELISNSATYFPNGVFQHKFE